MAVDARAKAVLGGKSQVMETVMPPAARHGTPPRVTMDRRRVRPPVVPVPIVLPRATLVTRPPVPADAIRSGTHVRQVPLPSQVVARTAITMLHRAAKETITMTTIHPKIRRVADGRGTILVRRTPKIAGVATMIAEVREEVIPASAADVVIRNAALSSGSGSGSWIQTQD